MNGTTLLFLVTGFEETEAIVPTDILRRGGVNIKMISLTGQTLVKGASGVSVQADFLFEEIKKDENIDMIILAGGAGTSNYSKHEPFLNFIKEVNKENKYIAAICAAPTILSQIGILEGKTAVCYPSLKDELKSSKLGSNSVEVDGNIITSKGPATSIDFALKLLELLKGEEISKNVRKDFLY